MSNVPDRIAAVCPELDAGVLGLYRYGSAVVGGLRRDSDIDLLLLSDRALSDGDRARLVEFLLAYSGRRATVQPGRPVELTAVVRDEIVPWRYPAVRDFQYGEWLRTGFAAGDRSAAAPDPDLAILLTTARAHSDAVLGPPLSGLTDPVPADDVRRAIVDSLPELLDNLAGDERNVLLTLARMVHTLDTGEIVPKDVAAQHVIPNLPAPLRAVLNTARLGYLGTATDEDWPANAAAATELASHLGAQVRSAADRTT